MIECPNCGSTELEWLVTVYVVDGVPDGRLKANEVQPIAALGCVVCSETVWLAEADDIAAMLPAIPDHGRQPVDN